MAAVTDDMDAEHAASLRRRHLIRFGEDTLRPRPLRIRLIIEPEAARGGSLPVTASRKTPRIKAAP
jgi:hypothetical protein